MPATRTRKPRARKHPASQPPVLRLPWMDAYSAMRAVGLSWYAWVAEAEARLPGIVNHAGFDASLTVSRATVEAARADAAAQEQRAHRDVHSGRPIPEHMTGGCGEADPGTSSVIPLTASSSRIWSPLDPDAERHLAAFEQAHDEASDGWARLSPLPDIAELDPEEDLPPGVTPLLPPHEPRQDNEALDEIPWPAPENGHATTPSSTYELNWPQP